MQAQYLTDLFVMSIVYGHRICRSGFVGAAFFA